MHKTASHASIIVSNSDFTFACYLLLSWSCGSVVRNKRLTLLFMVDKTAFTHLETCAPEKAAKSNSQDSPYFSATESWVIF